MCYVIACDLRTFSEPALCLYVARRMYDDDEINKKFTSRARFTRPITCTMASEASPAGGFFVYFIIIVHSPCNIQT